MNLAGFFAAKPASQQHLFFMVYFAEQTVQAVLWEVNEGQISVVAISQPHAWTVDADLIDATDHALQELGKESEDVKQTLFALEPTWVNQQGILADKKTFFQNLTKELALEAVGFVVIPEAIIQHQLYQKGTALHCFVVEILKERVSVSLAKEGKLGQQEMVGRSENVVDDIKEGFARFQDSPLPPIVLLYSSVLTTEELEECRQRLLELDLMSQFRFLQQPSFTVLPNETVVDVIVQTGGRAVAEARGFVPQVHAGELPPEVAESLAVADNFTKAEPMVQTHSPTVPAIVPQLVNEDEDVDAELGAEKSFSPPMSNSSPPISHTAHGTLLFGKLHLPHHPGLFGIFGIILGVAVLSAVFFFSSTTMMTAQVNIELKTNRLTKELSLRLDPQAVVSDPTVGILKAEVLKQSASGEKNADTTGKKIIGDKAKGKATLFNRTSNSKAFPAGTVLADGSLKFLLDSAVTVASASTGKNFETNPGTTEVPITAAAIGVESNIGGDKELTIDSFAKDTYIARTTTALSGGTSREIKAVSSKDQEQLTAALKKSLQEEAVKKLQEQVGSGKYVFPTNKIKVLTASFSAEVGKETNTFGLKMSVEAEGLAYSSSELQNLANQVLTAEVPSGQTLSSDELEVLTQPVTSATASSQVSIVAQVAGTAKPQFDAESIKQAIAGKSAAEALSELQGKQEIAKVEIIRQPAFFTRFSSRLPGDPSKIKIVVQ
jgi:hypothetical protein